MLNSRPGRNRTHINRIKTDCNSRYTTGLFDLLIGFEPTVILSVLQTDPFDHSGTARFIATWSNRNPIFSLQNCYNNRYTKVANKKSLNLVR